MRIFPMALGRERKERYTKKAGIFRLDGTICTIFAFGSVTFYVEP